MAEDKSSIIITTTKKEYGYQHETTICDDGAYLRTIGIKIKDFSEIEKMIEAYHIEWFGAIIEEGETIKTTISLETKVRD